MLIAEIAPYAAIAVTLIVWTLTQRANRKHEIFKERLKRRVEMFDGLLPEISKFVTACSLNNEDQLEIKTARLQEGIDQFRIYRVKLLCYGMIEEQQAFEEFVDAIDNKDIDLLRGKNKILVNLIKKNLRAEVGLK